MSNVWFTSDLHIGHAKVARIRGEEQMALDEVDLDLFVEWGIHDSLLAENWDRLVGVDDTVWVLGDISSGTNKAQVAALEWIRERPGKKHLIAGNHDGVHPLHRDSHKWQPAYLEAFHSVQSAARRRIPLAEGHVNAMLSHFPYTGDRGVDRYPEWRLRDAGHYVLHGHTHSQHVASAHPRQIHIGLDAWGFRPVHLDEVTQLIRNAEDAPPRDWEDVPLPLEGIR